MTHLAHRWWRTEGDEGINSATEKKRGRGEKISSRLTIYLGLWRTDRTGGVLPQFINAAAVGRLPGR